MFYFATRTAARTFANKRGVKPKDNGASAAPGRRWSVSMF